MAEKDQEIARLKLCSDVAWAHGDVAGSDFYLAKIAEQGVQSEFCPVCGGDGIQNSGVRGPRPCIPCDGTGKIR